MMKANIYNSYKLKLIINLITTLARLQNACFKQFAQVATPTLLIFYCVLFINDHSRRYLIRISFHLLHL